MPLGSRPTAGHESRQQQPQPQYPQLQQHSGAQWNPSAAAPHMPFAPSSLSRGSSFLAPTSTHRNQNYAHRRIPEGVGRSGGYQPKARVTERYRIVGFISSGTYGRVYKAVNRNNIVTSTNGAPVPTGHEVAIKKFKPDKEGEQLSYTGISQSAIREMSLCSELNHANVIRLIEIILEDKCIFMVFDYAEHDLLQIIHHHTQQPRHPIPPATVKSIMFQLLNGCHYLHTNWVLHRDLKPANIMVSSSGGVKIGDLGLARRFDKPLHSLFSGDKVVVTIWYRAPELILGSYHYTPAIDMWAIGCIFAELLSLRPIFKGEEAKMDSKKTVPFQRNQMMKIMEIMGAPTKDKWPLLATMPEYGQLNALQASMAAHHGRHSHGAPLASNLEKWYHNTISNAPSSTNTSLGASTSLSSLGQEGYRLLSGLLEYDPVRRLTAAQALQLPFFSTGDKVTANAFEGLKVDYPHRRVSQDDNDIRTSSLPGTKRSGLADDSLLRPSKRVRE
ncbi:Serine/threonine-protein kinase domain protein [Beauveria brongniartii RCEF 3172]|uniref:Serine/threonine-protein kinase SSN3 n=1 Tax=Beauveria brongniartii RCEF 3172 TaxID=1081107 RepID=A0A167JW73_9HYPO|nr:Serine/threonine-protein kinase domain protein [Beauveria brongniartii RCEF 3172]